MGELIKLCDKVSVKQQVHSKQGPPAEPYGNQWKMFTP